MDGPEIGVVLTGFAAVITAFGTLVASIRSLHRDVNGRMAELIEALRAKNVLDKTVSYAAGATDQRDAAAGVVVTAPAASPPVRGAAPKPLRRRAASRSPPK